jgi:hypothetical protein
MRATSTKFKKKAIKRISLTPERCPTKETASRKERYKKIVLDHGAVDRLLVEVFLQPVTGELLFRAD